MYIGLQGTVLWDAPRAGVNVIINVKFALALLEVGKMMSLITAVSR